MGKLKLNNPEEVEYLDVILTPDKHPKAYEKFAESLKKSGMTDEEIKQHIAENPIQLELYYEIDYGLMAVESSAVESGEIYSPYTAKRYEDCDDC